MKMDDLRLHDPLLVLRYSLRNKLARKPGWEWVENYVNSDQELAHIIKSLYKVSKAISYKFGVQVYQIPLRKPYTWLLKLFMSTGGIVLPVLAAISMRN